MKNSSLKPKIMKTFFLSIHFEIQSSFKKYNEKEIYLLAF